MSFKCKRVMEETRGLSCFFGFLFRGY